MTDAAINTQDAWLEGWRAYAKEAPESENPYPKDSLAHEQWLDGYEDGREDAGCR